MFAVYAYVCVDSSPSRLRSSFHKPCESTNGSGSNSMVCFAPLVTDDDSHGLVKGTVAPMSGVGGLGLGDQGAIPVHRSSLNPLRRKKITRSASLEDDDEITQRRRTVLEMPGCVRASQDVVLPRGRGRDGSYAFTAGYVRSQSVTDELLPSDRLSSGRFERRWFEGHLIFVL